MESLALQSNNNGNKENAFRAGLPALSVTPAKADTSPQLTSTRIRVDNALFCSTPGPVAVAPGLAEVQPVQLVINVTDSSSCSSSLDAAQLQLEVAKHTGALKGRVAKLEGMVAAGESKVRAQAQQLVALQAANRELEQRMRHAQKLAGITPERSRATLREVQEKVERAEQATTQQAQLISRLQAVLAYDDSERKELAEFTTLEYGVSSVEQSDLQQEVQQHKAASQEAAAQLAAAEAALEKRDAEAQHLQQQLAEAQQALVAAAGQTDELQQKVEKYNQVHKNLVKAEKEVELLASACDRLFRQVNYVRGRLVGHLPVLESSAPDVAKLARELQAWCEKEARTRRGDSQA